MLRPKIKTIFLPMQIYFIDFYGVVLYGIIWCYFIFRIGVQLVKIAPRNVKKVGRHRLHLLALLHDFALLVLQLGCHPTK